MTLKPLDIQQQSFPVTFRGYDRVEVTDFLEFVSRRLEGLISANLNMSRRLEALELELGDRRGREGELRECLLAARETADSTLEQARKQADLIQREAELQASRLLARANDRVSEQLSEISELARNKHQLQSSIRGILDMYSRLLDDAGVVADDRFNLRSPDHGERSISPDPIGAPANASELSPSLPADRA